MSNLSVLIIARDEEKMIGEAIESVVGWADEVIVAIDDRTEDKTASVSRKHGAKVVKVEAGDFSLLRNRATKKVKSDWVLYLDADERITNELKKEIVETLKNPNHASYAIPRRNNLLGRDMKYGGWWPDYVHRLIKVKSLKGWRGELHEQPDVEGEPGKLNNAMRHITHRSLREMIEKTNKWSKVEAELMYKAKHPPMNTWRFCSAMVREAWYRGVVKVGFLDGVVGVIEIIYQTFSRFVSYAKLWEMQQRESS